MKEKLTVEALEKMPLGSIFAQGEIVDSPEGINMTNSNKMLRWVAVRGGIVDWAIYCHWDYNSYEWIKRCGDKVTWERNIKRVVPCTDEAFRKYRY